MSPETRSGRDSGVEISVICPVGRRHGDLAALHFEFSAVLARTGRSAEFIYVVDGPLHGAEEALARIEESLFFVRVLRLARTGGAASALQAGLEQAHGRCVLTIPDRPQIDPAVLLEVLARLDQGHEVVVTRREPRTDAVFNRLQSRVFHGLVRRLVGQDFRDMTCGVRGFSARVGRKLDLYGDRHRFIPVIATTAGYRVVEVPGRQHVQNRGLRMRTPGVYAGRLLDILAIYFLTKFTRKPLRFFGLIGLTLGASGALLCTHLAWQRLTGASALADRPLLILGVLLIVLGFQVVSVGLIGEIIIFLSSRRDLPEMREVTAENELVMAPAEPTGARAV